MKIIIETDADHIIEEIEKAGFSKTARLRFTVEPTRQRRTPREIAEEARRLNLLNGISEEFLGHSRKFQDNFTIERNKQEGNTET